MEVELRQSVWAQYLPTKNDTEIIAEDLAAALGAQLTSNILELNNFTLAQLQQIELEGDLLAIIKNLIDKVFSSLSNLHLRLIPGLKSTKQLPKALDMTLVYLELNSASIAELLEPYITLPSAKISNDNTSDSNIVKQTELRTVIDVILQLLVERWEFERLLLNWLQHKQKRASC